MPDQFRLVADAFSRKATTYDGFGEGHLNLARMRGKVREQLLAHLDPGDTILELNAGTGADAAFLAQRGHRIHATDLSPGMVDQIRAKIREQQLQEWLSVQQLSFTDLDQLQGGPFQHIFSNMGGLNCIPELGQVARHLPGLLAPGGKVTWVIMPPTCLWELLAMLRGDWRTALRRLRPGGTLANVEGVRFMTYYFTPKAVLEALGRDFTPLALRGLSVITPPADRKTFARRFPGSYRTLVHLDDHLAHRWPFCNLGDFFVITLAYHPHG